LYLKLWDHSHLHFQPAMGQLDYHHWPGPPHRCQQQQQQQRGLGQGLGILGQGWEHALAACLTKLLMA
jgi:hypothetical protein